MEPSSEGLAARVLIRLTSPPVLPAAAALHGLLLGLVVVAYLLQLPATPGAPGTGKLVTGDFLAFSVGGLIVAEGQGRRLYDPALQQQVTRALRGPDDPSQTWLAFAYPPGYAIFAASFATLPYRTAFYVHDAILIGLALLTALALRPLLPELWRRSAWLTLLLAFTFHPVLRTLVGGQNTTLSLFLLTGFCWGLLRGDRTGSWAAGAFLGLLSYKPQFVLLPGLVLLARRDLRALAAAAALALLHYAVGALVCGPAWPLDLLHLLRVYQPLEAATNFGTHVALLSICEHLLPPGAAQATAAILSLGACAALALACARAGDDPARLRQVLALALALNLLVSPHTQYYDVGLLVLPALLLLDEQLARGVSPSLRLRALLLIGFLGYPVYELGAQSQIPQPLVLWPLGVAAWALWSGPPLLRRPEA